MAHEDTIWTSRDLAAASGDVTVGIWLAMHGADCLTRAGNATIACATDAAVTRAAAGHCGSVAYIDQTLPGSRARDAAASWAAKVTVSRPSALQAAFGVTGQTAIAARRADASIARAMTFTTLAKVVVAARNRDD